MKAIRGRHFLTALISRRRPTPSSLTLMTAYARSSFLGEDRLKESAVGDRRSIYEPEIRKIDRPSAAHI